jgi:hypothetical protein
MSLIKLWKNKGKILEGLKNNIFKQEHIEEIYNERKAICDECPKINIVGDKCYAPGTQPCCEVCGCSLGLLLRSLSSECEDGRWDAVLTEEQEDELNNQIRTSD